MFDFLPVEQLEASPSIAQECIIAQPAHIWAPLLSDIAAGHLSSMSDEELDNDWKLNEFFGTIAVINLPKAKERLNSISKELNSIGALSFEVFQAIDGRKEVEPCIWKKFYREVVRGNKFNPEDATRREHFFNIFQGEAGCYLSHLQLIKNTSKLFENALNELRAAEINNDAAAIENAQTQLRRYSRLLILEDDGGFGFVASNKKTAIKQGAGRHLRKALCELPANWDIFYLVVRALEPTEEISEHLRKVKKTWWASAYAINHTIYKDLISYLSKIEDPSVSIVSAYDVELAKIHPFYNVYAIYPSVSYQHAGRSTITSRTSGKLSQHQPVFK